MMSYSKLIARASQAAVIACLCFAGSSWAQSVTQTLQVTTHVKESCVINSTGNLAFPDYNPLSPTAQTGNGSVTMTCTKGSNGVTVGVDNGLHVAGSQRNMVGAVGGESLAYNLFQPDTFGAGGIATATAFGPGTFPVSSLAFTSGLSAVLVKIFGSIPASQDVTGQSGLGNAFTDTVTATVAF
jgi:spore coat protein U-like protein